MKRVEQSVVGAGRWLLVLGVLGLTACSAAGAGGQETGDEGSAASGASAGNSGASGTTGNGAGSGSGVGSGSGAGSSSGAGSGSGGGGPPVTFDWPETQPGEKCLAGKYAGMFNGIYMSSLTFFPAPIPVSGNVNISLGQSMNGEFFEVTDGKLDGLADGAFPFAGQIVGGLDCTTKKFTGQIKMAFYSVPGWTSVGFEGDMPSDYDKAAHSFINGVWSVHEANPVFGGNGTWTATWVGP